MIAAAGCNGKIMTEPYKFKEMNLWHAFKSRYERSDSSANHTGRNLNNTGMVFDSI